MTVNIDIAPGAALNAPELQRVIQDRLDRVENRKGLFAWWNNEARAEALRVRNLLAHYPWHEYAYKYGRWERTDRFLSYFYSVMKWAKSYDTFQLIEPASGRPIAEMYAPSIRLKKYSGRLWFAGDPRIAGVYTPVGDGTQDLWFASSRFVDVTAARTAALTLRPGELPPIDLVPYHDRAEQYPWVADHPNKPKSK